MMKQKFDFVIMDIQMPVMDGLEATRLIREFEARNGISAIDEQTIIGMSANSEGVTSAAAADAGMNCFLPKPFTLQAVVSHLAVFRQAEESQKHD
jgi:CheY-like chemotaxis protein